MEPLYISRKTYIDALLNITLATGATSLEEAQTDFDYEIMQKYGKGVQVEHEGLSSEDYALLRIFVEADEDSIQAEEAYQSLVDIVEEV